MFAYLFISITTAALLISLLEQEYKCSLAVTTYSSCVLQLYNYGGNVIVVPVEEYIIKLLPCMHRSMK